MRKIIKPGKICEHCGAHLTQDVYVTFCDYCKEKIPENVDIEATVFWQSGTEANHNEFCSFQCYFDWLRNIPLNKKMISFISQPYIGGSDKDFEKEYSNFLQSSTSSSPE